MFCFLLQGTRHFEKVKQILAEHELRFPPPPQTSLVVEPAEATSHKKPRVTADPDFSFDAPVSLSKPATSISPIADIKDEDMLDLLI
jgi:hypothetical protein